MIESVPVCMGLDAEDLAAKPSRSEVSQALNCLENGKSPEGDGIQLELLKLGETLSLSVLLICVA